MKPITEKLTEEQTRTKTIFRVTWTGFFVNLALSAVKLLAGIFGRSSAMIADAVHSLSDFATDVVVLFFVHISAKPKDETHDYGHGKFETLATIIIALTLIIVGAEIFASSIRAISGVIKGAIIPRPALLTLFVAAASIIIKEWLYRYTVKNAKKICSAAVMANAWHHRSDAFSSIGTLIGIGGAYFLSEKWRVLDPIAALVVSIFIIKVAVELILPGLNELLEKSLPIEIEEEIINIILDYPAVQDPHNLKTRNVGANIVIEVHVRMDAAMTVQKSHNITKALEDDLRDRFGERTQISIHVEPKKHGDT